MRENSAHPPKDIILVMTYFGNSIMLWRCLYSAVTGKLNMNRAKHRKANCIDIHSKEKAKMVPSANTPNILSNLSKPRGRRNKQLLSRNTKCR